MVERFGDFLVLDIGELERDRFLSEDAPYLPPFEIVVSATDQPAAGAALAAFARRRGERRGRSVLPAWKGVVPPTIPTPGYPR